MTRICANRRSNASELNGMGVKIATSARLIISSCLQHEQTNERKNAKNDDDDDDGKLVST